MKAPMVTRSDACEERARRVEVELRQQEKYLATAQARAPEDPKP